MRVRFRHHLRSQGSASLDYVSASRAKYLSCFPTKTLPGTDYISVTTSKSVAALASTCFAVVYKAPSIARPRHLELHFFRRDIVHAIKELKYG
jgi:hypothetical protein